jgi:chromosome segregation ATPase
MKNTLGLILLAIVCVGLGIALVTSKKQAAVQRKTDADTIVNYSNQWVETRFSLDEQKQVAVMLEKDLEAQKKVLGELTNSYTETLANLSKTEGTLKLTEEELKKREARILDLENQNQALETQKAALDKQAVDLTTAITNLTAQIAETQRKLAASEGDKAILERELKRLVAEKADLERQFNDLTVLRAQVAKLKEELSIARRVEWIRQGLFASSDQKGAQKLMQGLSTPQSKPKPASYDLNVEVNSDGTVKVLPPATNSPAGATNTPPR